MTACDHKIDDEYQYYRPSRNVRMYCILCDKDITEELKNNKK